jgi:chromosomal replication initiator protein
MVTKEEAWDKCLQHFKQKMPMQEYATWLQPLQPDWRSDGLVLLAPNDFVLKWVGEHYFSDICDQLKSLLPASGQVVLAVGSKSKEEVVDVVASQVNESKNYLNKSFTFENYVVGSSNELAVASAMQVCGMLGKEYNPLFLYGGVGLGKTHLMHAIGHSVIDKNPRKIVRYIHAERFVTEMVKSLRHGKMDQFKSQYRDADVLLVDDIQFFAGKERSQEEFFHTFNALLDAHQQVVLTSDRFPKDLEKMEDRLKSRFSWGLAVSIDPPELETRVAILLSKASQAQVDLDQEVAFFIAEHVRSNVREMEGALKRVVASAHFSGQKITLEFAKKVLGDVVMIHSKTTSVDNIQKTVAQYYGVKVDDLLSKRRTKSIVIPRQIAIYLARELTNKSLPELGGLFGGRDHTTVLYACRKVEGLLSSDIKIKEDVDIFYNKLLV